MTRIFFFLALMSVTSFSLVSCDEDSDSVTIVDGNLPTGDFTANLSGSFVAQNDTPTKGIAEIGTDEDARTFIRFGDDFTTALATGTVTVYLSTSENFVTAPGDGNPDLQLINVVRGNGEQFFEVEGNLNSKFTHIILWCASANIPFGYAALQ